MDEIEATLGMLKRVTHDCDSYISTQVTEGYLMTILLTPPSRVTFE